MSQNPPEPWQSEVHRDTSQNPPEPWQSQVQGVPSHHPFKHVSCEVELSESAHEGNSSASLPSEEHVSQLSQRSPSSLNMTPRPSPKSEPIESLSIRLRYGDVSYLFRLSFKT
jgi:hypothetical protein